MLLTPNPVAIRQFSYDATRKAFIADMSDTRGFGRVYDDACDEGLTIVGTTGRCNVFVVWEAHRDADGDVTHWTLRSVDGAYTLTLFND